MTALVACTICKPAYAHNAIVHQDMTDHSYEIMRLVENQASKPKAMSQAAWQKIFAVPQGVAQSDWDSFLKEIKGAAAKLRGLPSDLPPPKASVCQNTIGGTNTPPADWWKSNLGNLQHPVAAGYTTSNDCGIRYNWTPGGIFDTTNPSSFGHRDHTGVGLGFWAQNVDDLLDDTHLWVRPQNALGVSQLKKAIDEAAEAGLALLLIPFVCLGSCLFGVFSTCKKCVDQAKKIAKDGAQDLDPVGRWLNSIPGIGDETDGDYVTMWHFINVKPSGSFGPSNEFDDHQGLFYEEANLDGVVDPVDLGIMILMDSTGFSFNFEKSDGIKNYQVSGANDAHQNTDVRGEADWQKYAAAHIPLEPVDNLAFYGWKNFRDNPGHPTRFLGWPLHAIGDATSPMHVIATTGWGHRPYEESVARLWDQIRRLPSDPASSSDLGVQGEHVRNVLLRAFHWRSFILKWRKQNKGHDKDVPVRDLVTAVAQNTFDLSMKQKGPGASWPFLPGTSFLYLTAKDKAIEIYEKSPRAAFMIRPLIEDGAGAKIAFLTFATEVL
jgi:hypothetical protein